MAGEIGLVPGDRSETLVGVLTRDQRVLADSVCEQARTFDLRVRAVARAVWSGTVSRVDGSAVYGWLVLLDMAEQLDGVRGAA
jgi:hypothetical protein